MTSDELDFVNSLMSLPWVNGAEGPDSFDCWGLVKVVQKRLFGRDLPSIRINAEDLREVIREVATTSARAPWTRCLLPVHGGIVEMTSGRHPFHVGVYLDIDSGGILHCERNAGVCFDRIVALEASGWRRFQYNEWKG